MHRTLTLYDDSIRHLVNTGIVSHIQFKQKITEVNFINEVPFSVFSKRAFDIFNRLTDNVNISARWKNKDPQTGILEIYDYDRKRQK